MKDKDQMKATQAAIRAINKTLGKNASHDAAFEAAVSIAHLVCTGNGHLTTVESLHNAKCFGEQLILGIMELAAGASNAPVTSTTRLM